MAEIAVVVADAGIVAASGANYTDSKVAAVSGNNYNIPNNGRVGLILECTAGSTATVVTPITVAGLSVTDLTLTTTAAKIQIWGAFPMQVFNPTSPNMVVTVAANTNLFAFRLN